MDMRQLEDERFATIQAINAITEGLARIGEVLGSMAPAAGKGQPAVTDPMKLQQVNNRFADQTATLLEDTLFPLMKYIGVQLLSRHGVSGAETA